MKKQIKILILAVMLILACMLPVSAADATVTLKPSATELYPGDTFTVTVHAKCEEGINGIEGVFSYDESKLELIEKDVEGVKIKIESLNPLKWYNLGEGLNFQVAYGLDSGSATEGDIVKATFKVKDTAPEGSKAKVTVSNIVLDSDAATNSIKELGTKEVEISILERLEVNILEYEELQEERNKYINKINPRTLIETIKGKIQTNGIIKIFKNGIEIVDTNNKKIGTGMEIRISLNGEELKYKTVIKGDIDGDGEIKFKDILLINKHRLNKSILTNEYLKAADVNLDGQVIFRDILLLNKYRLGKISSL